MTKKKEPKVTDKYLRPGHIDQSRPVDKLVSRLREIFPSAVELPTRWNWVSRESFRSRYDKSPFYIANTASYQMLIVDGIKMLRLWTDSPNSAIVDIHDDLYNFIKNEESFSKKLKPTQAPKSVYRKTKPFTKRITIASKKDLDLLCAAVIYVFFTCS